MNCPTCYSVRGFPGIERGDGKCAKCYGTGAASFIESAMESFNILDDERPKCSTCSGTGICQTCRGSGVADSSAAEPEEPARERAPNEYDQPSPTYSSSSSGGDGGATALFGFLAFIAAAIAVLFSILAVIVSIPIWVGATAVAVIAAYFQSRKIVARIPAEILANAPLLQSWTKKRLWRKSTSKLRVDPAFLKQHIRWNPDLLTTTGFALAYAAAAGGLLVVVNEQHLVRIMFGGAVLGSIYLAWKGSRRMLEWKLAERVYAARRMPPGPPTNFAKVALGFSVVASAILVVLLITTAVTLPRELRQRRSRLATTPVKQPRVEPQKSGTRITQPRPRLENPAAPQSAVAPRQPLVASPPAASTTPTVKASTSISLPPASGDPMQMFADRFQELEVSGRIADVLPLYAQTVSYFDNGNVDRAFIANDKEQYRSRWTQRTERRTGDISMQCSGDTTTLMYPTHFRVENTKGEWIDGDADNWLQVTPSGGSFQIVGQQVRVKNRIKGISTSAAQSSAISSDAISGFVTLLMELERLQQLDSILAKYASRVDYFDNGVVDHTFIRKDKADYYARWPSISYQLRGGINATQINPNVWEVRAPTKFHVANQRGEWIGGDVTQTLTIDTSGPSWLITSEKGEITRREKGTGLPPTESSTSSASSGSSQAIGGGAFRGKGTVYKIPDLKSLVGKQLSNAWLYGEFAFEQQHGNVAVCRTAATVLFVGKGTTKVNIEFAGGFSVSDRILASMRDPQLPLTFTLRTAPNNPIRLMRVRQNRDGTLEAFARSPIRLDLK